MNDQTDVHNGLNYCNYRMDVMSRLTRTAVFHMDVYPDSNTIVDDVPSFNSNDNSCITMCGPGIGLKNGISSCDESNSNFPFDEDSMTTRLSSNRKCLFYNQYKTRKCKPLPKANYDHKVTGIKVNHYAVIRTSIVYSKEEMDTKVLSTEDITIRYRCGGVDNGQYTVAKSEIKELNFKICIDIYKFFDQEFIQDFKQLYLTKALELFKGKAKTMDQLNSIIRSAFAHAIRYLMEQNRPEDFESIDEMHEAMRRCIFIVTYHNRPSTVEDQLFSSMAIPCLHAGIMLVYNLDIPTTLTPLELLIDFKNNQVNNYKIARVEKSEIVNGPPICRPDVLTSNSMSAFHCTEDELLKRIESCTGRLYSKNQKKYKVYPLATLGPALKLFSNRYLRNSKKDSLSAKQKNCASNKSTTAKVGVSNEPSPYCTRSQNRKPPVSTILSNNSYTENVAGTKKTQKAKRNGLVCEPNSNCEVLVSKGAKCRPLHREYMPPAKKPKKSTSSFSSHGEIDTYEESNMSKSKMGENSGYKKKKADIGPTSKMDTKALIGEEVIGQNDQNPTTEFHHQYKRDYYFKVETTSHSIFFCMPANDTREEIDQRDENIITTLRNGLKLQIHVSELEMVEITRTGCSIINRETSTSEDLGQPRHMQFLRRDELPEEYPVDETYPALNITVSD